jgi:hypothetical protein
MTVTAMILEVVYYSLIDFQAEVEAAIGSAQKC